MEKKHEILLLLFITVCTITVVSNIYYNQFLKIDPQYKLYKYVTENQNIKTKYTPPKYTSTTVIPKKLFQTWHTRELPPSMINAVNKIKTDNPELEYYLFDEDDCLQFIKHHFTDDVVNAFIKLVPGAYKADLWRYCVIYIHGGVYLDIKYQCIDGFKLIDIMDKERFVLERPNHWKPESYGIYNALIIAKPKNPIFLDCIKRIVKNTQTNYFGFNELYPTGPGLVGDLYFNNIKENIEKIHDFDLFFTMVGKQDCIIYKNAIILKSYSDYRQEQAKYQTKKHYTQLWREGHIYELEN